MSLREFLGLTLTLNFSRGESVVNPAEVRIGRVNEKPVSAEVRRASAEVRIGRKSSRGANEKRVSAEVRLSQLRCVSTAR